MTHRVIMKLLQVNKKCAEFILLKAKHISHEMMILCLMQNKHTLHTVLNKGDLTTANVILSDIFILNDIKINDVVKFLGPNGKMLSGRVKAIDNRVHVKKGTSTFLVVKTKCIKDV